jgi:hypothetical protein
MAKNAQFGHLQSPPLAPLVASIEQLDAQRLQTINVILPMQHSQL